MTTKRETIYVALTRIADALDRIAPPLGWEYETLSDIADVHEDAARGWEIFAVTPEFFVLRRPAKLPARDRQLALQCHAAAARAALCDLMAACENEDSDDLAWALRQARATLAGWPGDEPPAPEDYAYWAAKLRTSETPA